MKDELDLESIVIVKHDVGTTYPEPRTLTDTNPLVRPAYERFMLEIQRRGWADENGKAILPIKGSSSVDYDRSTQRYTFTLRAELKPGPTN